MATHRLIEPTSATWATIYPQIIMKGPGGPEKDVPFLKKRTKKPLIPKPGPATKSLKTAA